MTNTEILEHLAMIRMYVMDRRNGDYNEAMEALRRIEQGIEGEDD